MTGKRVHGLTRKRNEGMFNSMDSETMAAVNYSTPRQVMEYALRDQESCEGLRSAMVNVSNSDSTTSLFMDNNLLNHLLCDALTI
jgi:hypothetical protein